MSDKMSPTDLYLLAVERLKLSAERCVRAFRELVKK
jgi:hypothetical protein